MSTPTRQRPAVVAAAVLLVVLVCGTGALQLLSQLVSGTTERTSTLAPTANRFVVQTGTADVTVVPSTDGQVHVRTSVEHGLGQPRLIEESTADGVRLDVACEDLLVTGCDVRYEVAVPAAFDVVVTGVGGDVAASGITGAVRIVRENGDITLFGVGGPLDLRTTTGEISGEDVRSAAVYAESASGDVRLDLLAAQQTLDVETTTGEIDLAVPTDVGYRLDARTVSGDERVTVPVDASSSRTIRAVAETGDVRIRPSR